MALADYDLTFLRHATALVDEHLDLLDEEASKSPDPDSFGVYDRINYTTGFGFVACQTNIGAISARQVKKKSVALEAGPKHSSGATIASLVNACANHWKHSGEWPAPALRDHHAQRTTSTLAKLGVDTEQSYTLVNALYALTDQAPSRFRFLVPMLIQWRDSYENGRPA